MCSSAPNIRGKPAVSPMARLSTSKKNKNGANSKLRHALRVGGVTSSGCTNPGNNKEAGDCSMLCVYTLIDKLGPVREVLVQKDDKWEERGLEELTENLRLYVERNPLRDEENNTGKPDGSSKHPLRRKENLLFGKSGEMLARSKSSCAYCHSNDYFGTNCTKVLSMES